MGGGSDSKKQLGKILLQQRLVSADALQDMLDEQKREPGSRLASTAARRGRVSINDALHALSEQHGVPAADLSEVVIALSTLRLVPVEMAREHGVLPIKVDGDQLVLAMASPQQQEVIDEINFVAAKKVVPHVALDQVVRQVIEHAYAQLDRGEEYYVGSAVSDVQLRALGLPELPRAPEAMVSPPAPAARLAANVLPPPPEDEATKDDLISPVVGEPPRSDASGLAAALDTAFAERVMPSQPPVSAGPANDVRALIAHGDGKLRSDLGAALQSGKVSLLGVEDGPAAIEQLRTTHPDLFIVDPSMPGMQGLDLCRRLRANARYVELPIVAVASTHGGWRIAHDLRESFGVKHYFERTRVALPGSNGPGSQ